MSNKHFDQDLWGDGAADSSTGNQPEDTSPQEGRQTGFDDREMYITRKKSDPLFTPPKQYYNREDYERNPYKRAKNNRSQTTNDPHQPPPSQVQNAGWQGSSDATILRSSAGVRQGDFSVSSCAKKKPRRGRKKVKKWPFILTAILIMMVGAFFYVWNSSFFANETDGGSAGLNPDIGGISKEVVNILFVGIDSDQGRETNQLTDTILVVSVNMKENQAHVLQIPRDTYIGCDYTQTGKVNALYSSGGTYTGIDGLAEVLYQDFCIPIDHYATVTMEGFRMLIDEIGGVSVDVPYEIALDGVILEPGVQTLDGNQAEKFIRQRHGEGYSNGDLDRLRVQRLFMASLVDQILQTNKFSLLSMIPKLSEQMSTDLTTGEMTDLLQKVSKLSQDQIQFEMLPGESAYVNTKSYGKQSVYSVHKDLMANQINQSYRYGLQSITAEDILIPEIANTINDFDDVGGSVEEIIGQDSSASQSDE